MVDGDDSSQAPQSETTGRARSTPAPGRQVLVWGDRPQKQDGKRKLEEVQAGIADIKQILDRKEGSDADIEQALNKLQLEMQLLPTLPAGSRLWRGVAIPQGVFPQNISGLKNPPHPQRLNRANRHGESVTYCSVGFAVVLSELQLKPGDWVAVLCTRVRPGMSLVSNVIGDLDLAYRCWKSTDGDYPQQQIDYLDMLRKLGGEELSLAYVLSDGFMADLFSRPIDPSNDDPTLYRITSAWASKLRRGPCVAVSYPSVRYRGGMNVAPFAKAFDFVCQPSSGEVVEIVSNMGHGLYSFVAKARSKGQWADGRIDWRQIDAADQIIGGAGATHLETEDD